MRSENVAGGRKRNAELHLKWPKTRLENGTYIKVDTIFIKVVADASDLSDP